MWRLLLIGFVLCLSACAGPSDQNEKQPSSDENIPEQTPTESEEHEGNKEVNEEVGEEDITQEQIIEDIKDEIVVDFKVKLPEELAVADGRHLSAVVVSEEDYYEVTFIEADEPLEINDPKLFDEKALLIVRGKIHQSTEAAGKEIGYQPIQEGMPEVDLGYGITGYQDAGAGSSFITWHEGRWSFIMRSRNDEAGNAAGEKLAKEIVEKLEKQTLPIPHEQAAGTFSSGEDRTVDTNRIAWQEEDIVYEVYGEDALHLIDIVTNDLE